MDKKKILIADDQEDVLSLLSDFLSGHDFEVMVIKNPKEISGCAVSFAPNLILLDLLMPVLGGFDVCEILNKDERTREIPIIIITGFGNLADVKKAYNLGAVGYLVKPFSLEELLSKINKTLSNKETRL